MPTKQLPPAEDVTEEPYAIRILSAPSLTGLALRAFIKVYEVPSIGSSVYSLISVQSGVKQVLHETTLPEPPMFLPWCPVSEVQPEEGCSALPAGSPGGVLAALTSDGYLPDFLSKPISTGDQQQAASVTSESDKNVDAGVADKPAGLSNEPATFHRPTVAEYVEAYQSGKVTPAQVCDRILAFLDGPAKKHQLSWFISSDAARIKEASQASTQRWAAGKPLSILDGVPFAVKDTVHVEGYQTTVGTSFVANKRTVDHYSPWVKNLLDLGAVLLGKTTMHEIGLGITGLNMRTGTARNPYNTGHHTGGSSAGSAAVIAAGLCPIATGTDGGGSIRIPASFCGVVGLKPTNGRVTSHGAFKVDLTVAATGPITGCVQDAAVLYAMMANWGCDSTMSDEPMPPVNMPKPLLPAVDTKPLAGMKAGIYWDWFNHAEPKVVEDCKAAVKLLQDAGVEVVNVTIPELDMLRVAHNVTIISEMLHCFMADVDDPATRQQFNPDVRLGLASAKYWTPADYLQAQRIRRRATTHFRRAMKDVSVLITPATACTAPVIPRGALTGGHSNLTQVSIVMRNCFQANMLGLPAISVPVGKDEKAMPIGLQLLGKPWQEATLLRFAAVLEALLASKVSERQAAGTQGNEPVAGVPKVWINPLTGATSGV